MTTEMKKLKLSISTVAALLMAITLAATVAADALEGGVCNMSEDQLMGCKPCIRVDNPVDTPSDACCAAMKQANLPCLCSYKNSMLLPYLGINPALAMKLPAKCGLTPPSQC